MSRYQSLSDKYVKPFYSVDTYVDNLESISIKRQEEILSHISNFHRLIGQLKIRYINTDDLIQLRLECVPIIQSINALEPNSAFSHFHDYYENIEKYIDQLNEEFIRSEILKYNSILSDVDNKSLDYQQRVVVVSDDINNLAIAGAGSGKTLSIAAKVKYLVEAKLIPPKDILLISYTAKSAAELRERIKVKLGLDVEVKTFHKLGLEIISNENGAKPDIIDDSSKIIYDFFKYEVLDDVEITEALVTFMSYYIKIPADIDTHDTLGGIISETSSFDDETIRSKFNRSMANAEIEGMKKAKITINKEVVKSYEEVQIANFLYLNGIEYEYERKYEIDTKSPDFREYRPDFYLLDYGIYLEHFGLNKDMKAPWLSPIEEQKYLEGYDWKKQTHENNKTKLIETFSYYNSEGNLIPMLKTKLEEAGIVFYARDTVEIYKKLFLEQKDRQFEELIKLFNTFISLLKSNKKSHLDIEQWIITCHTLKNDFTVQRSTLFLSTVRNAYIYYQNVLGKRGAIDFNDMLNDSTDIITNGGKCNNYKYTIIDEFQDSSMARYNLIKAIRDRTGASLLCVGDDWQSIYRFTGSDVEIFTDFKKFFGSANILKIENTYRNSQGLIDIAGAFIMKNPSQIKKDLKSSNHSKEQPITIIGYETHPVDGLKKAIEDIVKRKPDVREIMLIGRNNSDILFIDEYVEFKPITNLKDDTKRFTYTSYPKIQFSFLTAHRSKGLEAEVTIIINVNNGNIGFPNKIADDPILEYVLTRQDTFRYGEERRLFYVALTRTKSFVYITTKHVNHSEFVDELIRTFKVPYLYLSNPHYNNEFVICPRCKTGHLVQRESGYRKFLGCSLYPGCDYAVSDVGILKNPKICPECGGFLVRKEGSNNKPFLGCSNYKVGCRYTAVLK